MTAPLPSPRLSPTAGFFNALVRELNKRLRVHIADLLRQIDDARDAGPSQRTARNFADSAAAGYIDRSFLER